jgi:hypothetical protein
VDLIVTVNLTVMKKKEEILKKTEGDLSGVEEML